MVRGETIQILFNHIEHFSRGVKIGPYGGFFVSFLFFETGTRTGMKFVFGGGGFGGGCAMHTVVAHGGFFGLSFGTKAKEGASIFLIVQ
jgi:hypothetical protein